MRRQVTQSEIVTAGTESLRHSMYHVMPGTVVSYTPGPPAIATIQPMTNDVRRDLDTGALLSESWDVLKGVPIAWPRFGGYVIQGSLNQYDPVLLVAFDLDPTSARAAGRSSQPVDPADATRHAGGYWVAIPTDLSLSPTPSTPSGKLTIGAEGKAPIIIIDGSSIQLGATGGDHLALASKVDLGFANVVAAATAAIAAVVASDGGAAAFAAFKSALVAPATASPLIKAQ